MSEFKFGSVYIIERDNDLTEIRTDLQNMRDHGYNLITLWPIGNPWLAVNSHNHIFTRTREVLDLCEELGLQAILQLFGQNQSQEFMPDSVLTVDMMTIHEKGRHMITNCFWANLNHPVVRDYIDRFFKEAINEFKEHPAVYGYDVFNEAHFNSEDPYTLNAYREWLKKKYGTIEVLNHAWYRRYESFSQIETFQRRAPYSVWSSLLPDVDYEKFKSENLTEICQFLYDTAAKYDTSHPIIIDGTSSQILYGDFTMRNNDEFETALIPDVYGSTFYPKSWGRNYRETPWKLSMYYSMPAAAARRAGKPYMVNELQTHVQSVLTPGSEVSPSELYDWIWMCIFSGAEGMQLWRWRPFRHGYQSTGRGLTRLDGRPNERAAVTKKLADIVNANRDLFDDFRIKTPRVKIAVSYANRLFFDVLLKWEDSFWPDEVEGWYKLFWMNGILPEFTDAENMSEEDLSSDMIVLPSMLMLSDKAISQLEGYVAGGGKLVADARLGVFNTDGEVPKEGAPGKVLSEVFGIREIDVTTGESFVVSMKEINADFMSQILEMSEGAEVHSKMTDGTSAIVSNHYGKGQTLYFNSFIGLTLLKENAESLQGYILSLLNNEKTDIITADKSERVHISYIESDSDNAMLVINFSDEEQKVSVRNLPSGVTMHNIVDHTVTVADEVTELVLAADTVQIFRYNK